MDLKTRLRKIVWWFLSKLNVQLLFDPAILFLAIMAQRIQSRDSKRHVCTHIHCSLIHNHQNVEAVQMSVHRWQDKQNVVYVYNGIIFSPKKEGNSDTGYRVDEP